MKTREFCENNSACRDGMEWALTVSGDMAQVWDALIDQKKYDWLLWTVSQKDVVSTSVLRKLFCRFVRETPLADGRKVWDLLTDERSRHAVEVSERFADGLATQPELAAAREAAREAAWASSAAREASSAASSAAAWAARAAREAACAAAREAAREAAWEAACAAAREAACAAAREAAREAAWEAAREAAWEAQIKMIAEIGNPFKGAK